MNSQNAKRETITLTNGFHNTQELLNALVAFLEARAAFELAKSEFEAEVRRVDRCAEQLLRARLRFLGD